MKIVYCGCGDFGINSLDAILSSSHTLAHVFTHLPRPAGRGRKPKPTAVCQWAKGHNVDVTECEDLNMDEMVSKLATFAPDVIVVIAFGQKISEKIVELPHKVAINVHASLLPKYRGAAPINWAIINGETKTGVSIITLAQKMDAGLIAAQAKIVIQDDDTADIVHDRLAHIAAPLLIETLDKIENGTVEYTKQDISQVSRAPKFKKSNGYIDWNQPAEVIHNKIRGMWPWPGTGAYYISKKTSKCYRVTIARTQLVNTEENKQAQTGIIDENMNVICETNSLKILRIKPAGSRLMDFEAFVNGRGTGPGDMFMPIDEVVKQNG
jgi:methionyl-tRNA formyltransferase